MGPSEGGFVERLVSIVEGSAWLGEELARDPISAGKSVVWFSCPLANCAACSPLLRQGIALVCLAPTAPTEGGTGGGGSDDVPSKRRWLPAVVLARPFLTPDTLTGGEAAAERASPTHRCCSATLSPCLAEALGLNQPSPRGTTSSGDSGTSGASVAAAPQLFVRELPSARISGASAVELSGPHPVSAATSGSDVSSGQAPKPAQQQAQLAAAVTSILPCALDGQVLAEGSVVRVAGLFSLVVTRVSAEDGRRPGRAAKEGEGKGGQSRFGASAGCVAVRVYGSTELRLSPTTRPTTSRTSARVPAALGPAAGCDVADGASAVAPDALRNSRSRQRSRRDCDERAAAAAARPVAAPPYRSLDATEWTRLVEQDFGGLGDEVATAIAAMGTVLKAGGGVGRSGGERELSAPASGLLLHGPTGTGKTLLARC